MYREEYLPDTPGRGFTEEVSVTATVHATGDPTVLR
jgi:hypothetical protein